ncbi:MAG: hypothetical protein JWN04_5010 [Myxococcaceae bacterium]|nr:hypothetical protein [Myxococcaceae bacterium]
MNALCQHERTCQQCGEPFWGGARENFCSASCRARRWRAAQAARRSIELAELCEEILRRRTDGSASYSKLLPRALRAVATELRKRGWDPIELLLTHPRDPATLKDEAPGGFEGDAPERRRWLYPPERELDLLNQTLRERIERGLSVRWHLERQELLLRVLHARAESESHATASSGEL